MHLVMFAWVPINHISRAIILCVAFYLVCLHVVSMLTLFFIILFFYLFTFFSLLFSSFFHLVDCSVQHFSLDQPRMCLHLQAGSAWWCNFCHPQMRASTLYNKWIGINLFIVHGAKWNPVMIKARCTGEDCSKSFHFWWTFTEAHSSRHLAVCVFRKKTS